MNYDEYTKFMEALQEESREHSLDGNVSYPYIAGVLESYLRNAVSENEYVRNAAIETMKESIV